MPPPAHTTRGFRGSLAHLGPPVSSRGSSTGSPSGVNRAKRASCPSRAAHRAGFSGRFRAKSQQVWAVSATTSSMSRSRDAPVHSRATPSTPAPARDLRPAAPSMSTRWAPSSRNRFGQGGQLPGGGGPRQLDIPVGQGPEYRHRAQGGHHVGEIHHLQGGVAQGEHPLGGGEQISPLDIQVGLLRARHQVGALAVPAHRGQAQALLPQLRHQAAHGGGLAGVLAQADHRHRRGVPHQRR